MAGSSLESPTTTGDDTDYMPLDIIFRILLWLPVSSLLRFKCVSKSCFSLIENSDFVYQHIHKEEDDNKLIVLSCPDEFNKQHLSLLSLEFDNTCKSDNLLLDFPTIDDPYQFHSVELVASCNGIICLRQGLTLCLWNPATKQSINLPPIPESSRLSYTGFGFDVKTNDYKLMHICSIIEATARIYTLASDYWTTVDDSLFTHIFAVEDNKALYHNGFSYWITVYHDYDDGKDHSLILLSFDYRHDTFATTVTFPNMLERPCTLFVLQGNIACTNKVGNFWYGDPQTCHCEIWMLNDGNFNDSWTKLYMIQPFSIDFHWITCFSKNRDFLLFLDEEQFCLYDLVAQETMKLPLQVSHGFEAVMYRESLFSVKRGKGAPICVASSNQNEEMLINQSVAGNNRCGNNSIPEVVVFHILLWLPVASLLRFKLVCVSWYHLIKNSDFVAQHLFHHHHQKDNNNINFILHSGDPLLPFEDSSHPSRNTSCTCLLSADKFKVLDLPYCRSWGYQGPAIVTSFDGIICLRHDFDVYLWNPATKQFRALISWEYSKEFHFGFGYDVKTKDYKLVIFHREVKSDVPAFVQVYNLCTDTWRTIVDKILPTIESIEYVGPEAPCRNGIYYWLALVDYTSYSHTILSFDFSDEVFRTIALPDSINSSSFSLELAILRENIVCISMDKIYISEEADNWCFDIWMMNEYGIEASWTKLYTVGPFSQDWHVQTYYSKKNGDYILLLKDGQLYAYNLVSLETKRIPVQVQGPETYHAVIYEESLVPVKSGYY